jgi:hypothetical protein
MKWFDPPRTLLQVKKRGQLILLFMNIIIASVTLFKLDQKQPRSYSVCQQQYNGSVVCYCSL